MNSALSTGSIIIQVLDSTSGCDAGWTTLKFTSESDAAKQYFTELGPQTLEKENVSCVGSLRAAPTSAAASDAPPTKTTNLGIIVGAVAGSVLLLTLGAFFVSRRKPKPSRSGAASLFSVNSEENEVSLLPKTDKGGARYTWRFDPHAKSSTDEALTRVTADRTQGFNDDEFEIL